MWTVAAIKISDGVAEIDQFTGAGENTVIAVDMGVQVELILKMWVVEVGVREEVRLGDRSFDDGRRVMV